MTQDQIVRLAEIIANQQSSIELHVRTRKPQDKLFAEHQERLKELEKEDRDWSSASITFNAIPRSSTLAERLAGRSIDEIASAIQKDRLLLFDYLLEQAQRVSDRTKGEVTTIERYIKGLAFTRGNMEKK